MNAVPQGGRDGTRKGKLYITVLPKPHWYTASPMKPSISEISGRGQHKKRRRRKEIYHDHMGRTLILKER